MKHTPGPWTLHKGTELYSGDNDADIVHAWCRIDSADGKTVVSDEYGISAGNMRLMAAAPEMLEALMEIARKAPQRVSREEAADMACEFHIVATEAIAKAKGTPT